jgi:hypothetical protein
VNITKDKIDRGGLEQICALYLRRLSNGRRIERVRIASRANPARNWFVTEIEPCLPIASEMAARAALADLQSQFDLDE